MGSNPINRKGNASLALAMSGFFLLLLGGIAGSNVLGSNSFETTHRILMLTIPMTVIGLALAILGMLLVEKYRLDGIKARQPQ